MSFTLSAVHVRWLSLLGYPTAGTSEAQWNAWFEREACQWEMAPQMLQRLIDEFYEPHRMAPRRTEAEASETESSVPEAA